MPSFGLRPLLSYTYSVKTMAKLITLARRLDFTSETEYFDYCINSWFNGQLDQCRNLFSDMTKKDRKGLIRYIQVCYDHKHEVETFYFNLL